MMMMMNEELRETLGLPECLMCNHSYWNWYEVIIYYNTGELRGNSTENSDEILYNLCDKHRLKFLEAINEDVINN